MGDLKAEAKRELTGRTRDRFEISSTVGCMQCRSGNLQTPTDVIEPAGVVDVGAVPVRLPDAEGSVPSSDRISPRRSAALTGMGRGLTPIPRCSSSDLAAGPCILETDNQGPQGSKQLTAYAKLETLYAARFSRG